MMEHVQATNGKVQHLADVPEGRWQAHDPDDGVQYASNVVTLCGKTLTIGLRRFANPDDCRRCRARVDEVGRQLAAAREADTVTDATS